MKNNKKNNKKYLIIGTFDLLHPGHVNLIYNASKIGEPHVLITSDSLNMNNKSKTPLFFNENMRKDMIDSLVFVKKSKIFDPISGDTLEQIAADWDIDGIVFGTDYFDDQKKKEFAEQNNLELIFFERTDNISSTYLKEEISKKKSEIRPRTKNRAVWTFDNIIQFNGFKTSFLSFYKAGNKNDILLILAGNEIIREAKNFLDQFDDINYKIINFKDSEFCREYPSLPYFWWISSIYESTEYEKIVFYDNDVIINSKLDEMVSSVKNNYLLCGRKVEGLKKLIYDDKISEKTFLRNIAEEEKLTDVDFENYINTGVIIVDIEKWINKYSLINIINELSSFRKRYDIFVKENNLKFNRLPDQEFIFETLHKVLSNDLELKYNLTLFEKKNDFCEIISENNWNIHYLGRNDRGWDKATWNMLEISKSEINERVDMIIENSWRQSTTTPKLAKITKENISEHLITLNEMYNK